MKLLKRAMAAEYIRELSVKTLAGQSRLARLGFHVGGTAPFALQRALVDESGAFKGVLARGQQKSLKTERVILMPGLPSEVATVRRIFDLFVSQKLPESKIAIVLNNEAVPVSPNGTWTRARIHKMLVNENYIGNLVFNRRTQRFKTKSRVNTDREWVRCEGALEAVIDPERFREAQRLIAQRKKPNEDMLKALSRLHCKAGRLSKTVIEQAPGVPVATTYRTRFGSLRNAYALIGHPIPSHYSELREDPVVRRLRSFFYDDVLAAIEATARP
jgi:hypothetical protein